MLDRPENLTATPGLSETAGNRLLMTPAVRASKALGYLGDMWRLCVYIQGSEIHCRSSKTDMMVVQSSRLDARSSSSQDG